MCELGVSDRRVHVLHRRAPDKRVGGLDRPGGMDEQGGGEVELERACVRRAGFLGNCEVSIFIHTVRTGRP